MADGSQPAVPKPQGVGVTIAAGESVSPAIDATTTTLSMIAFPDDWTPANLTFLASGDGVTYYDVFDIYGRELMMNVIPGVAVVFGQGAAGNASWYKIRSGTRDLPVVQEASRQFMMFFA